MHSSENVGVIYSVLANNFSLFQKAYKAGCTGNLQRNNKTGKKRKLRFHRKTNFLQTGTFLQHAFSTLEIHRFCFMCKTLCEQKPMLVYNKTSEGTFKISCVFTTSRERVPFFFFSKSLKYIL